MAEKPTARDVHAQVDEVRHKLDLTMACIWGAVNGTAPRDRWDTAAADLDAAAEGIARARAALAAMEKLEPYCTTCGEPILNLMAGWSHFSSEGRGVSELQARHEPDLDWRPVSDG